ncbi:hypothetical protein ZWY2020_029530 [Hordeum vulgare]|nr:hypothetical protein ZWY2020_029530 [Hordeum vulgare]
MKSYARWTFGTSRTGKCYLEAEITPESMKPITIATTQLECPVPPASMYLRERQMQARHAVSALSSAGNVVFGGDMSWDDDADLPFPLPAGWADAWVELKRGTVRGLQTRSKSPAVRTTPPTTRRYYHAEPSTRRPHEALQPPGLGRQLFCHDPLLRRPPPVVQRPRCYSSSKRVKSQIRFAGVVIVCGVVVTVCYGTFETVPYTNRRHFIVLTLKGELRFGDWVFNGEKKKLGDKVLPPSHPDFVGTNSPATQTPDKGQRRRHHDFPATNASADERPTVSTPSPRRSSAAGRSLAVHNDDKLLDDMLHDGETWAGDAAPNPKKKKARRGAPTTKHLDGFKWEVMVVNNKQVNAMCAPGGKIIVYTGLLDNFSTDAEIAATVLGHEVGHAVARHTAEELTKNMWIMMLAVFLEIFIDAPKLIDKLTEYLLRLPFSRKLDLRPLEADYIGIMLLASAGFDPRIAPKVHEKLGNLGGNSSSSLKHYMSTHPCSKKRTQLLLDSKVMDKAMALYTQARARKEEIDQ